MKKITISPMFSTKYNKRYGIRVVFNRWIYVYMETLNSINKPYFFLNKNPFLIKFQGDGLRVEDVVNFSFFKKFFELYDRCTMSSPSFLYFPFRNTTIQKLNKKKQIRRLWLYHILTMQECHKRFHREFNEEKYKSVARPIAKNIRYMFTSDNNGFPYGHFYFHDMELMKIFLKHYFLAYDEIFNSFYKKLRRKPFIQVCKILLPISENYKKDKYAISYHPRLDKIEKEIIYKSDERTVFSLKDVYEKDENIRWDKTDDKRLMKILFKHSSSEKDKLVYKSKFPLTDKERNYFREQSKQFMGYFPELDVSFEMF